MQVTKTTHAQLTAPGNGEIVVSGTVQAAGGQGEITLAAVDTNVVVRYDYSNDNFSTTATGIPVTLTANGTHVVPVLPGYAQVRPVFVSEAGGTAATLDIVTKLFY